MGFAFLAGEVQTILIIQWNTDGTTTEKRTSGSARGTPGGSLAMPLLRLLCLLWFWPTFIGAAFTGLVFLVAFLLRDAGLVRPKRQITKR